MFISKIRAKTSTYKHNEKFNKEPTKITTIPLKGTTTTTNTTATITSSSSFNRASRKTIKQNKAKILSSSSSKQAKSLRSTTTATTTITCSSNIATSSSITSSSSTATTTTTPLLPQTNLLKIEPFVPSLTNRPNKTIRRSYSTLSNTTLKKLNNQQVNKKIINQLEIKYTAQQSLTGGKTVGNNKLINGVINSLPKVLKPPTTLRRRPVLRGPINRQRSKSTSSSNSNSNSNSNCPTAASSNTNVLPSSSGTPCNSPHSVLVVQQPNGICRIQRHAKEQEKLPDRINYDKRGLTAIPIFENETNLRLLSLQHNLINTFHIPKEQEQLHEDNKQQTSETEATNREQTINGISCRNAELNISGNQSHQHFCNNKQKLPLAVAAAKPNVEHFQPQLSGQLMLPLNTPNIKNPLTFGSYILQRNKLLHKSINMNNCQLNNHRGNLQHPAQLRFGMRKSKSFVSNQNLQLNVAKQSMANQRSALLGRTDAMGNLKSFDSSTTDSTQSTLLTAETDDSQLPQEEATEVEGIRSMPNSPLAITNKQLAINYGNTFKHLVFLDLYDNQIERISNLDGLITLTVLLLGKNRISDISGLSSVQSTLRVLDLHGNKLCSISNKINCLKELKSLNLAGNQIRQINHNDFLGLLNLKELNLKRNKLKRINGFQHLIALERLWLCHNDLHKVDDMSTIAQAQNLIEITIENNPLTLAGDCVSFLVSYLPKLQTLSQMPITEQVRKAAMTWRTNRELSEANNSLNNREVFNIIRREEIISNARTNWELLRSQQMVQNSLKSFKNPNKSNSDLEKITETSENNYEEFIKLPPIESQQQQQQQITSINNKETEERASSVSSLGPNINSSSSCYSSQDEDDTGVRSQTIKPPNNIHKPSISAVGCKEQKENTKNQTLSTDNNHQHQRDSFQSLFKCNNKSLIETTNTPTIAPVSNCAPTLNLQFPMETNRVSSNQQNQAVTSTTTTSVSSSISSTQTVTAATVSSSMAVASTASASLTLTKRYMTGGLMRSQTIVGTVTGAGGVTIGFGGNSGGYTNGYMVKTNNVATANSIRYQSKMNPNATTQTAAITTLQQTITMETATATAAVAAAPTTNAIVPMTMITTTAIITPTTTIGIAIANNNANNSLMASSINSNNTSLTLNTNKTLVSGASNSITDIAAQTTVAIATGPCGATSTKLTAIEREREQGGDYLIEICGRYLNIYGQGALRFIDKQWNPTKANDVHTLNFSYINFNNIASVLGRIKVRFVHAENFVFRETNINCLGQLNALAELQGISSLSIDEEGNSITGKDLWRPYAIYRLSHWGLKTLNNIEVKAQEIEDANALYTGLSELILWSMPEAMLQPLLTRLRLDEPCSASKLLPKQWLSKPDNKSLRLVVGKEALQWKKSGYQVECSSLPTPQQTRHVLNQFYNNDTSNTNLNHALASTSAMCSSPAIPMTSPNVALTTRERGKIHFTLMIENTCNAVEKLHKLEQIWPHMLQNAVRNTLLDYSQLDVYIRNLMAEIMK